MRSVVSKEEKVGLLLFDEPSASLDPTAEHGERSNTLLMDLVLTSYFRSLCSLARIARRQDYALLLTSLRQPYSSCRSHTVGFASCLCSFFCSDCCSQIYERFRDC